MNGNLSDQVSGLVISVIIVGVLLTAALMVTPFFLLGAAAYVGGRLYLESPARAERLAKEETMRLYQHAMSGRVQLSDREVDLALSAHWPAATPDQLQMQLLGVGRSLFAAEGLSPDIPPPPVLCNTVEGGRYRDLLAKQGQARNDPQMLKAALDVISQALAPIAKAAPPMNGDVLVSVSQFLTPHNMVVDQIVTPFFQDNGYNHFKDLRQQLDNNLRQTHRTSPVFPRDYRGDDAVDTYLKGTLLRDLFDLRTPFEISEELRFEHMHMVAGSGHGKTQTLQYLIAKDLPDVAAGAKSVVVIDSQGDLIGNILRAKVLEPEDIILINPEDIAYPVSLNLFSVGQERLDAYSPLERERLTNSIIELYDFVLGSLLSAGMTAKQSVVFRYVTRLMFHIPDATIHTLCDLMEAGGTAKYQEHIAKLEGTPRRFFETEFESKEFAATKTQVLRRLYGVLENQTFERMFANPQSKFDMFSELNAGKLILINTSKSLLKEQGTEIFGRFFIALIAQAAQERAVLRQQDRLPAMIYIDEAQDYFDANIGVILSQARKYRVGMVMAHQYLGQLSSGLSEAFEANTSIKLAGGVSARDARTLASQMHATPELIQQQPKGSFATYLRGLTDKAVPIAFPFFELENLPRTTKEERAAILQHSRDTYAQPWEHKAEHSEPKHEEAEILPPKNDDDDPLAPSPEL
jgi:hypothetical protein